MLQRDRRRIELERVDAPIASDPLAYDDELAEALGELLLQQRAAVALFYLEDRPVAEVAEMIGVLALDRQGPPAPGTQTPGHRDPGRGRVG